MQALRKSRKHHQQDHEDDKCKQVVDCCESGLQPFILDRTAQNQIPGINQDGHHRSIELRVVDPPRTPRVPCPQASGQQPQNPKYHTHLDARFGPQVEQARATSAFAQLADGGDKSNAHQQEHGEPHGHMQHKVSNRFEDARLKGEMVGEIRTSLLKLWPRQLC